MKLYQLQITPTSHDPYQNRTSHTTEKVHDIVYIQVHVHVMLQLVVLASSSSVLLCSPLLCCSSLHLLSHLVLEFGKELGGAS